MGVVSMAKDIKKVHPEEVVCYKVGAFVQTFGKDAYILSYLFGYKLNTAKENIPTCGFPKRGISKVCAKLEQRKINYVMIDTRNNYEIDEKNDNKNLNTYNNSDASVVNIYCDGYIGSSGTNNISYTIRPITCIPTSVFNEKYLSSLVNE